MSMSIKAIFAKVSKHLIKQNARSVNEDGDCAYRDHRGQSCAIGCLIPEDRYYPRLEGMDLNCDLEIRHVLTPVIGVNPKKRREKLDLLQALLIVHDECDVSQWETELATVKAEYLLICP